MSLEEHITYMTIDSQIFKIIAGNKDSKFTDLSIFEKNTNERHNDLIGHFIPKEKRMSGYTFNDISFIEDWMNTLPRRILKYKTPEEVFEAQLDIIYEHK